MQFNVDAKGHTSLRGGAQNLSSVNVFIDGVGQKSYVKEGGVSGQFFSQGNPFPQLAIGEYKVITSNYKAEYDQVSSAAITAGTKSGTNDFHGEVFGTYTDDGWRNRTPAEEHSGKKTPSHQGEYGLAFGGPILEDALHFLRHLRAQGVQHPDHGDRGRVGCHPVPAGRRAVAIRAGRVAVHRRPLLRQAGLGVFRSRPDRGERQGAARGPDRQCRRPDRAFRRHRYAERRRSLRRALAAQCRPLVQRSALQLREIVQQPDRVPKRKRRGVHHADRQ
jgi:hypothetical protein